MSCHHQQTNEMSIEGLSPANQRKHASAMVLRLTCAVENLLLIIMRNIFINDIFMPHTHMQVVSQSWHVPRGEEVLLISPCCLTQHCFPRCISHSLCSRQLICQQLKDGISSIAVILGLSSMAVNSFVLILPLFYIQNGMCGNGGVGWVGVCVLGGQ